MHFGPLAGLLVHELDRHRAGAPALTLSRVSFDILGFLGIGECEVRVRTVRPGRTIELLEAEAHIDGRVAARARGWYLADFDTAAAEGGEAEPLPSPDSLERDTMMIERWTGGFVNSLDVRVVGAARPGRTTAWLSSDHDLVEGDPIGAHAAFVALVDTANGIAVREDPRHWVFPNVDLTVHFHRRPAGHWVGLDTTVTFGATGQGVTATVLHDEQGAVGSAHQALTVRPA